MYLMTWDMGDTSHLLCGRQLVAVHGVANQFLMDCCKSIVFFHDLLGHSTGFVHAGVGDTVVTLSGFSDSNWAGGKADRKSTAEFVNLVAGGTATLESKKTLSRYHLNGQG